MKLLPSTALFAACTCIANAGYYSATCTSIPIALPPTTGSGWSVYQGVIGSQGRSSLNLVNSFSALAIGEWRPRFKWEIRYYPSNLTDAPAGSSVQIKVFKSFGPDSNHGGGVSSTLFEVFEPPIIGPNYYFTGTFGYNAPYEIPEGFAIQTQSSTFSALQGDWQQFGTGATRYYKMNFDPGAERFCRMKMTVSYSPAPDAYGANMFINCNYNLRVNGVDIP